MTKKDIPANRQKSSKANKTSFQPGKSGNPKGAPKRGESWAELFNVIGNLTGEQAAGKSLKLWAQKFKSMPKGITLKELVVIRAYAALLDESNARLLKEVMDRAEGKMGETVKLNAEGPIELIVTYATNRKSPKPTP